MKRIKKFVMAATLVAAMPAISASLGPNVISDGDFTTGNGWILGTNWQILSGACPQNGVAWRTEGSTSAIFRAPDITMTAGATYRVTYTISGTYDASDPRHWVRIRGDTVLNTPVSTGDGTFTFDVVAPANVNTIGVVGVYGFSGILDEVSVREVTP